MSLYPPGWRKMQLSEVLTEHSDGSWGSEAPRGDGTPVIRSTDMRHGVLSLGEVAFRKIPPKIADRRKLLDGDILVNKSSGSAHLVGASVLFRDPKDGHNYICSNFVRYLRPNRELVDPEYLYFFLQSPYFREEAVDAQRTTSGLRNLKFNEYVAVKIAFPPLTEQYGIVERIKECLSRVDEIKRLREETRQEVEETFSSLLAEFFDPAWPCKPLGSLAIDIRNGWSGRERKDGSIAKMLRLSAVHSRTIDPTESKDILLDTTDIEAFRVVEDDVFIVRGNGSKHLVGRSAIADSTYDNVVFNDLLIRLRFVPDIFPRFANCALHLPALRRQIEERAKTAAGIWKINQTHLSELLIPCPDPSDQLAAIERIERATEVCEQLAASVGEVDIDALPQVILRKAFAGGL